MVRRKTNSKRFKQALNVADDMSVIDQAVSNEADANRPSKTLLHLEQIKYRTEDTRELNQEHVLALSESIEVLGLIEPLVVDTKNRLLAGGHRLAAINFLCENKRNKFEEQFLGYKIPVRVMPFDADVDPEKALQCEVAENEHRRDYTPTEVKSLAERLKKAGYSHGKGRPRRGKKALLPALEVIIGKHTRTIQRYLSDHQNKNTTNVVLTAETKRLKRIEKDLLYWKEANMNVPPDSKKAVLLKQIPSLTKLISQVLTEIEALE